MKNQRTKKNFFYDNITLMLSVLLFIAVVILLGIPHTNWGFKTDDFGNIFHCKINSFNSIIRWFFEGSIERVNHPSNTSAPDQAFFCGLFRPVSFIYYYIQYLFFGPQPYGYFLVTIILHALNTALLFNLFLYFTSYALALLGAALFAFHPSLWNWLGWISAQTYYTEFFTLLLLIFALKKYLDTKKMEYYFLSCFLFTLNLFLKEATFFLPIWIIAATYLYLQHRSTTPQFLTTLKQSFVVSIGYWIISIGYICTRAAIFPLTSNTTTLTFEPTLTSFIARQKSRIFDFVTYVSDMLGLSWMPNDHQRLKGSIIIFMISLLVFLFIKSRQKMLLLFLAWSMMLFSWPALIMHYQPRYIYMAIPFFILMALCSIQFYKHSLPTFLISWQKPSLVLASLCITYNASFLMSKLTQRETVLHQVTHAFEELIENNAEVKNRTLCFVGIPRTWFDMGTAQAIWLLTGNDSNPVYQYNFDMHLANKHSYLETPTFEKDYLHINFVGTSLQFASSDVDKIWFSTEDKKREKCLVQAIDPKHHQQNPLYITWDYKDAKFMILNKDKA